jgi:hypothetical protein
MNRPLLTNIFVAIVCKTEPASKAQTAEVAQPAGGDAGSEAPSNPTVDKKLRAVLSSESLASDHGGEDEDMGKRDDDAQKELLRAQHVFNFRRKKLEDSQSVRGCRIRRC